MGKRSDLFITRERTDVPVWGGAKCYPGSIEGQRGHGDNSPQIPATRRPKAHVAFYRDLHPEPDWEEAFRPTNGNINFLDGQQLIDPAKIEQLSEKEMPKFENITYPGNTHRAKKWAGNRAKGNAAALIPTWMPGEPAPDPQKINWRTDWGTDERLMIAKFVGICKDGGRYVNLFDPAVDNFLPLFTPDGEMWIEKGFVEWYPDLGPVTVRAWPHLNVRNSPGITGEKIGELDYGTTVEILEYYPSMGDVWGLTAYGWIALRYQPWPGFRNYYEPNTWSLMSPPALRPYRQLPGVLPIIQQTGMPPYPLISNQRMINIFYQAAAPGNGWMWIERAGLTSMAVPRSNRQELYDGPPIEDIVGLEDEAKDKILELLEAA
ncbi:MAG: SH3 domain-containing protein [Chloroflexi bacterium]|nr:SH3 domain-containing protein [Chloroflexota bacterium]